MVSSGYSVLRSNGIITGVTTIRKKYLGARKTCLRLIRDDLDRGKLVCATKLKHFAKKIFKQKRKSKKLDLDRKYFSTFLKMENRNRKISIENHIENRNYVKFQNFS